MIFFLTMTDTITSQRLTFPPESSCVWFFPSHPIPSSFKKNMTLRRALLLPSSERIQELLLHNTAEIQNKKGITGIWSSILLLGAKILHLVERTDLFKNSNLVYGGRKL